MTDPVSGCPPAPSIAPTTTAGHLFAARPVIDDRGSDATVLSVKTTAPIAIARAPSFGNQDSDFELEGLPHETHCGAPKADRAWPPMGKSAVAAGFLFSTIRS
jgi:hypothetical protein